MPKPRAKTGEKRLRNQLLHIDRLPIEVRDAIQALRDQGRTWKDIEELSALPKEKGGFIDWDSLETNVLELFPTLRLSDSNLQRWFDLRVSQVTAEAMARSAQARVIATAFAKSIVKGEDEAVVNAARDQLMAILAEDATPKGRMNATKGLIALADIMNERRLNEIKERKVATDERKMKLLEEREAKARRQLEAETAKAAKKVSDGRFELADLNTIRERVFGLPPLKAVANGD
jgi:hypothetical protein